MTIGEQHQTDNFDPDFADPAQWAAMYRAVRFQPVPAWSPAEHKQWKRPKLPEWRKIQNEILPQDAFDRLYGPGGEYVTRKNMGVVTGPCSDNLFVVDLDVHKTPQAGDWWRGLLAVHNNGLEPETPEQMTGGGGRQILFRAPGGRVVPTCKTSIGVDIRGDGGFAMLPPSLHESGREYAWLPGCAPWELDVAEAPDWLLDAIDALVRQHGKSRPPVNSEGGSRLFGEPGFDGFGHRDDGRESYMRDLVWAAMVGLWIESPIGPPNRNAMEVVWQDYLRNVVARDPIAGESNEEGLEREGRGRSLFEQKWAYAAAQWDVEVAAAAAERRGREADPTADFREQAEQAQQQAKADPGNLYEYLDVDQIMAMPDPVWLIDGLINEGALGFIYGPPSSLKTFIALDIALSFTAMMPEWWGRGVKQHGTVIYLCREGVKSLKFRIQAWEQHRQVQARGTPFYLIQQNINFMSGGDVGKLLATVEAIVAKSGRPVTAVFVDTISRVLPGAEENQQKDMSMFVGACDAVRQKFNCTVFGVHHTNKVGGFRGSTVMPAAGDFMIETRREPGAMTGSIFAFKIKDGEDGWEQHFTVAKVTLGDFGTHSSLVLDPTDAVTAASGWPDRNMQQRILYAITEARAMGKPWSPSPQSGDRYAPRIMAIKFQIDAKIGRELISRWLLDGTLINESYDDKSKMKGLKVVQDAAPQ